VPVIVGVAIDVALEVLEVVVVAAGAVVPDDTVAPVDPLVAGACIGVPETIMDSFGALSAAAPAAVADEPEPAGSLPPQAESSRAKASIATTRLSWIDSDFACIVFAS
jgi:hypothetical protein